MICATGVPGLGQEELQPQVWLAYHSPQHQRPPAALDTYTSSRHHGWRHEPAQTTRRGF